MENNSHRKEPDMTHHDLEPYIAKVCQEPNVHGKIIDPASVVTAPWVRFKCLFGCPYKHRYSCPPHTPTPAETREVLDSYRRAILFHREEPAAKERGRNYMKHFATLVQLEGDLFKDGYYKSFLMIAGPCTLCKECSINEDLPCRFPERTRPSMEACGIDVYQTVRNNGFFIKTLHEKTEPQNIYCLMLVD